MTAVSELLSTILSLPNIPWASCFFALGAVGFALGYPARASRRVLTFATLAVAQAGALLACWILAFRYSALMWATDGPPHTCMVVDPSPLEHDGVMLAAVLLTLGVPGLLVAARRRCPSGRGLLEGAAAVVFATGASWSAALSAVPYLGRVHSIFGPGGSREFEVASGLVDMGGYAIIGVSVVAGLLVLVLRWRKPQRARWRWLLVASFVFVVGLGGYRSTRDHAHDRHHPMHLDAPSHVYERWPPAPSWLDGPLGSARDDLPEITFDGPHVLVFGRRLRVQDVPGALAAQYDRYPRGAEPRTVRIRAPIETPIGRLQPLLKGLALSPRHDTVRLAFSRTDRIRAGALGPARMHGAVEADLFLRPYGEGSWEAPELELTDVETVEDLVREWRFEGRREVPVPAPPGYVE